MTGPKFFQTRMGVRFFEIDVPAAINAVVRLAEAVEDHAKPMFNRKFNMEAQARVEAQARFFELAKAASETLPETDRCIDLLIELDRLWLRLSSEQKAQVEKAAGHIGIQITRKEG